MKNTNPQKCRSFQLVLKLALIPLYARKITGKKTANYRKLKTDTYTRQCLSLLKSNFRSNWFMKFTNKKKCSLYQNEDDFMMLNLIENICVSSWQNDRNNRNIFGSCFLANSPTTSKAILKSIDTLMVLRSFFLKKPFLF